MYLEIYKHVFKPKFTCRLQRECLVFQLPAVLVTYESLSESTFKDLQRNF